MMRPQVRQRGRLRGFTLVELIVSMGVLVGLMTMVGMIFTMATNAASAGTANMSVYRMLRAVREVIEADLRHFDPGSGAMAIYGWEQLAFASTDDRASDRSLNASRTPYNDPERDYRAPFEYHRADVLMLVTSASTEPYAVDAPGLEGTGQILVFGHADLGEILVNDSVDPADHTWEAASRFRRLENGRLVVSSLGLVVGDKPSSLPASRWHLARRATVFTPMDTDDPQAIGWTDPQYRLNNANDRDRVYRAGGGTNNGDGYPGGDLLDEFDIEEALSLWAASIEGIPDEWYYPDVNWPDRRTVLDETPPPGQQGRMAYHFLPGCVDFKVELTFDDPRMVWLMNIESPGQPPMHWFTVPSGKRLEWIRGQAVELNDTKNQNATQPPSNQSWQNVLGRAYGGGIFPPRLDQGTPPNPQEP
ncbi:MAG: type II secretion system protein, partial [Phycisphaerales bacterium]